MVAALKSRYIGIEVVRARLCDHGKGLVYVLTVLARDGKVGTASMDAASGAFLNSTNTGINTGY